ncbi:MAG: alanine dehydrogenase [Myxococcota bacterium]|nr:alanine dehydrogenase [Myxococcota bacterium]
MRIGVPKEVKVYEGRVALTPAGARALVGDGHCVFVEETAGIGSGISDEAFKEAGATILSSASEVWGTAELVLKVKEPVEQEYELIQLNQIIFTYFHLAAVPSLLPILLEKNVTAIAYETIETRDHRLPLLHPMSEIAGKMSVQIGANLLESDRGGKGVLLGGVPGVRRGRVVVLGGGTVGTAAAKIAMGLGAHVSVLDVSLPRLAYLDDIFGARVNLLHSNPDTIAEEVERADLVVGAVLVTGNRAPILVSQELVARMESGSVIMDVAVDQGGCIETIRGTTHESPTYFVHEVLHYGVTNMPGAVAHTSTYALTNATILYAMRLAIEGIEEIYLGDAGFAKGVNVHRGSVRHQAVADALKVPWAPLVY